MELLLGLNNGEIGLTVSERWKLFDVKWNLIVGCLYEFLIGKINFILSNNFRLCK